MELPHYHTADQMRGRLAQVIPAWFPPGLPDSDVARFLAVTLADADTWSAAHHIVVVADGQERVASLAEDAARGTSHGPCRVICLPDNRGKAGAVAAGLRACLEDTQVAHVAIRDADGDHLASDAPNLYRLARQMEHHLGTSDVVVVGGRGDVRRPMGLERAEYELLLNDLVWNALCYHRATKGAAINTQFWAPYGPYPDMQSGFKLYTRTSAHAALAAWEQAHEADPGAGVYRWGCELPPVVDLIAAGGVLGQVARLAVQQQPVSAYADMVRHELYGKKAAWCLNRLGLPAPVAKQLFDNALTRRPLYQSESYRPELLDMRRRVLASVGVADLSPPAVGMLS